MERKQSTALAPAFMVSAPAKVIVFGEHAAVYGKPAVAAAISLRSYLLFTTLSKSQRTVRLDFRDIRLYHTWAIDDLPWHLFRHPSKKQFYYSLVDSIDPELLAAVAPHAEAVSAGLAEKQRRVHVQSATAFLYLFLSLGLPDCPGFVYTLRSVIPLGAGLGSSASVCVCLSTALLLQIRALAGPHPDQLASEADLQIERINRWAFVGELCIHGDPSGVDNTVSAGGKAVVFQKNPAGPSTVTTLAGFPKLQLLLVDTRQPRSTAVQVQKIRDLRTGNPALVDLILEGIGTVTSSAMHLISSIDLGGSDEDEDEDGDDESERCVALEQIGALIRVNHGLLDSLGISHPRLERVREIVDETGAGWAKLTGAGGGGCAITVLKPDLASESRHELEQKLAKEGFVTYDAVLGGDGVGVLWPAFFRSASQGTRGGEEIDQQKFVNAVGPEGIEQLVGVGASEKEHRQGWRFWSRSSAT